LALAAKSGRCGRTTQKRWPVALHHADAARAELLQTAHFRLDVVALDIEMHAAFMTHLLHFEVRLVGGGTENAVQRLLIGRRKHRQLECRRPEICGRVEVGAAVDDESGETALVHGSILSRPGGNVGAGSKAHILTVRQRSMPGRGS